MTAVIRSFPVGAAVHTTHDPAELDGADVVVPDGRWLAVTASGGRLVVETLHLPGLPFR